MLLNAPADATRVCKTCKTKLATLRRAAVNAFKKGVPLTAAQATVQYPAQRVKGWANSLSSRK